MENLRTIDVLIIGAGPAGTVCGSLLKQAGVECAVVDHATFPREKVCGGGLTVKAWRLLDELMPGIKYEYRPINHMRVQFEDDKVCDFHSEYEIRMTRRTDFDYDLLKYYQNRGGEFIKGSFARFEKQSDGRILVTLKSGMQFSCRYLIAADGANSMIRKQMTGAPKMHALFLEYYVEGEHDDDISFISPRNTLRAASTSSPAVVATCMALSISRPTTTGSAIQAPSVRPCIISGSPKVACAAPISR